MPSEAVARTKSVATTPQIKKIAKPANQLINPKPGEACSSPPEAAGPWHVKAGEQLHGGQLGPSNPFDNEEKAQPARKEVTWTAETCDI